VFWIAFSSFFLIQVFCAYQRRQASQGVERAFEAAYRLREASQHDAQRLFEQWQRRAHRRHEQVNQTTSRRTVADLEAALQGVGLGGAA
jgi:hypothetical protein